MFSPRVASSAHTTDVVLLLQWLIPPYTLSLRQFATLNDEKDPALSTQRFGMSTSVFGHGMNLIKDASENTRHGNRAQHAARLVYSPPHIQCKDRGLCCTLVI